MSGAGNLIALLCCAVAVVVASVVIGRAINRRFALEVVESPAVPRLPEFAIIDCGDQIHFVPVREDGHLLGPGRCDCHPCRTANRRRCGRRVVYVDHRPMRHAPAVSHRMTRL